MVVGLAGPALVVAVLALALLSLGGVLTRLFQADGRAPGRGLALLSLGGVLTRLFQADGKAPGRGVGGLDLRLFFLPLDLDLVLER